MKVSLVEKQFKSPESRLRYWIIERETIRTLKEVNKLPPPWTDDEILSMYRFCNVVRIEDKVSQWLFKNWYQPFFDHGNMLLACTLARQLNNPESLEAIGFPKKWNRDWCHKKLTTRASMGLKNFSGAYMITGTLGGTKIEQIICKVVDPIHKSNLQLDTSSIEKSVEMLLPFSGFSTFIAGQVVADMVWAVRGEWNDRKTWAAIGPGSRRGINRILGLPVDSPRKQAQFNEDLVGLMERVGPSLPPELVTRMDAIDWQNCLCEFDKYERTRLGQGRPKQKYKRS